LEFVQAILKASPKARTWCTLDFDALHQSYRTEHSRVVAALDYLAEKGWIALEAKQMTDVYAVLQPNFVAGDLATELCAYFQAKEVSEIRRIQAVMAFFESHQCLTYQLARYFGDAAAPEHCGHCSVCQASAAIIKF
jgi:ATP-dependent DNA helicase RecQ